MKKDILKFLLGFSIIPITFLFLFFLTSGESPLTLYRIYKVNATGEHIFCHAGMDYCCHCFYYNIETRQELKMESISAANGELWEHSIRYEGSYWEQELVEGIFCAKIGSCSWFEGESCLHPNCDEYSVFKNGVWSVE